MFDFESDRIARIFARFISHHDRPLNAIKVTFRDLAIKIAVKTRLPIHDVALVITSLQEVLADIRGERDVEIIITDD